MQSRAGSTRPTDLHFSARFVDMPYNKRRLANLLPFMVCRSSPGHLAPRFLIRHLLVVQDYGRHKSGEVCQLEVLKKKREGNKDKR